MADDEDGDWAGLGEAVQRRRLELGLRSRDALAAKAGISARTLGDIERGQRGNYANSTWILLETALGWAPGSVAGVLSGGQPHVPNPANAWAYDEDEAAYPSDVVKAARVREMDADRASRPVAYDPYGELDGLTEDERRMIENQMVEMARAIKRARGIT